MKTEKYIELTTETARIILFGIMVGAVFFWLFWESATFLGGTGTPPFAYYHQQAQVWLRGHWDMIFPPTRHDLTRYNGDWYLPFPPLPALLLLPWVWAEGMLEVDTILFSLGVGAVNVTAVFFFLNALKDRGIGTLNQTRILWLTVLFGIGSVHWYMVLQGTVWFLAQLCAIPFVTVAAWGAAKRKSGWFVGAMLGIAMLSRPHLILLTPFYIGLFWEGDWDELKGWGLSAVIPLTLSIASLLAYNYVRFDALFDFGYLTQNVDKALRDDLATYGQFNMIFIWKNLKFMLFALPKTNLELTNPNPNLQGLSIFFTTPALLFLVAAFKRNWMSIGAWLSIGLVSIPLITYYNTGWWQFGYRFSLDFMIPILLLLVVSTANKKQLLFRLLVIASVCINALGAYWFAAVTGRVDVLWLLERFGS